MTENTIVISVDGDQWCALLGTDLQSGYAGFGSTPSDALRELARQLDVAPWNFSTEVLHV